jgi:hypothetical protein
MNESRPRRQVKHEAKEKKKRRAKRRRRKEEKEEEAGTAVSQFLAGHKTPSRTSLTACIAAGIRADGDICRITLTICFHDNDCFLSITD